MGSDYTAAALAILAGVGMAVAFSAPARFVGERRVTRAKQITYEAGSDPVGSPRVRIAVRFYPVAIIFLVSDIEVAFLYPWAVNYASLSCAEPLVKGTCQAGVSWLGLGAVVVFMAVLLVALAYVWRQACDRMGLEDAILSLHIETRSGGELGDSEDTVLVAVKRHWLAVAAQVRLRGGKIVERRFAHHKV